MQKTAPADGEGAPVLPEVIVTAQKREESLQKTPISIVAFDADALQEHGITGVNDLNNNLPGLTAEPFPTDDSTLRIFIRGVGYADSEITQDPAVGVYIDGVYIARSTGLAMDLADLQRVEVLRGPQGTLYGRNTTGGAVNFITSRPDPSQFFVKNDFLIGSRNGISEKATINVPIGRTAAVRLSMLSPSARTATSRIRGVGGNFGDERPLGLTGLMAAGIGFDSDWLTLRDYGFDYTHETSFYTEMQSVQLPNSDKGSANLIKGYAETQTIYSTQRHRTIWRLARRCSRPGPAFLDTHAHPHRCAGPNYHWHSSSGLSQSERRCVLRRSRRRCGIDEFPNRHGCLQRTGCDHGLRRTNPHRDPGSATASVVP